jgi:Fe-S-cluster formation regulator IscX/YfhJ
LIVQVLQTTRAATSEASDLDSWVADFSVVRLPAPRAPQITSQGGAPGPVEWRALLAADVAATLHVLDCPKPVIAQVHGYALAGGLELAMACDLIVAAEGAKLGEPEIRYGSAPVALLMPYLIGQKKTRELLLTGDLIDYGRAARTDRRRVMVGAIALDDIYPRATPPPVDFTSLNEALEELESFDPQKARVVELRFFGGLSVEEVAEVVGISTATVKREWSVARAWLAHKVKGS